MGVAIGGCVKGIPSIGFALCDHSAEADFEAGGKYIYQIASQVLKNGLPSLICLNVNIPEVEQLKGIKVCRQANGFWTKEYDKKIDEEGNESYWLTGYFHNLEPEAEDTDEWH